MAHAELSTFPPAQVSTFAFVARNTDELSFAVGDKIVIKSKPEGGWWEGRCGS